MPERGDVRDLANYHSYDIAKAFNLAAPQSKLLEDYGRRVADSVDLALSGADVQVSMLRRLSVDIGLVFKHLQQIEVPPEAVEATRHFATLLVLKHYLSQTFLETPLRSGKSQ